MCQSDESASVKNTGLSKYSHISDVVQHTESDQNKEIEIVMNGTDRCVSHSIKNKSDYENNFTGKEVVIFYSQRTYIVNGCSVFFRVMQNSSCLMFCRIVRDSVRQNPWHTSAESLTHQIHQRLKYSVFLDVVKHITAYRV